MTANSTALNHHAGSEILLNIVSIIVLSLAIHIYKFGFIQNIQVKVTNLDPLVRYILLCFTNIASRC